MAEKKSKTVEPSVDTLENSESTVEVQPVKQKKVQMIQTLYGRMVDPHTGLVYDQVPSELFKLTSWVQSQIDAGKMKLV